MKQATQLFFIGSQSENTVPSRVVTKIPLKNYFLPDELRREKDIAPLFTN